MEVQKAKGGIYPLAFFVMLILLNAYCRTDAAIPVKSNTSVQCNDRLGECLTEDEVELEYLMSPYISRMLDNSPKHPAPAAVSDPNTACNKPCSNQDCKAPNIYACRSGGIQTNMPWTTLGYMCFYILSLFLSYKECGSVYLCVIINVSFVQRINSPLSTDDPPRITFYSLYISTSFRMHIR